MVKIVNGALAAGSSSGNAKLEAVFAKGLLRQRFDDTVMATPPTIGATITNPQVYKTPVVTSDGHGGLLATLAAQSGAGWTSPAGQQPAVLRLLDYGWTVSGTGSGETYIAPAVNQLITQVTHGRVRVVVGHYGSQIALRVWSRGGQWRARVDGDLVQAAPTSIGTGSVHQFLGLDFGGVSKARVIEFELWHGGHLNGLWIGPTDALWTPAWRPTPKIYWIGDSFEDGSFGPYPGFRDLVHIASARAGFDDVIVDALGGTGYVKVNSTSTAYGTRLTDNMGPGKVQPDLVVVCGNHNDAAQTNVGGAATALYSQIHSLAPAAKILVVQHAAHQTPVNAAEHAAVLAAATASQFVSGVLECIAPSGTGRSGATTGAGSADLMVSSDSTHPTDVGHEIHGREIGEFLARVA